ncbi:MAG TPA: prephenate dehydrogenase/arogenate dehydrogenase family protein, partial [Brevundimonas sp.]|nr:prephenate dehydrogenase/arogenate dehydrogenase family protein [Brevundimonas sp.]
MSTPRVRLGLPQLGLIGFGAFGRLTARHLSPYFDISAYDPAARDGEGLARLTTLEAAAACPVVVLAVPVEVLAETVAAIAPHMTPGALILDVGSVKVKPAKVMLDGLPQGVQIVGTHPLFGPQSGKDGIAGLRVAVCPVRGDKAAWRVAAFCRKALGLKVFVVTPEDHDREAATVQ